MKIKQLVRLGAVRGAPGIACDHRVFLISRRKKVSLDTVVHVVDVHARLCGRSSACCFLSRCVTSFSCDLLRITRSIDVPRTGYLVVRGYLLGRFPEGTEAAALPMLWHGFQVPTSKVVNIAQKRKVLADLRWSGRYSSWMVEWLGITCAHKTLYRDGRWFLVGCVRDIGHMGPFLVNDERGR